MDQRIDTPDDDAAPLPREPAFGVVPEPLPPSSTATPSMRESGGDPPGRPEGRASYDGSVRHLVVSRLGTARFALMAVGGIAVVSIVAGASPLLSVGGFLTVVIATALGPRRSRAQRLGERASALRTTRRAAFPDAAAVTEALPDPAFLLDPLLAIVHQNAAADAAFGPSPERFGVRLKFRSPELRDLIERCMKSREEAVLRAHQPVSKDRWFEVRAVPIRRGAERSAPYTLLLFREQTEARRDARLRSDFIANASHELRTPLASLAGFIETLQGPARNDPAARERFLGIMAEQAGRMTRLVNDLMSLSSLERRAHVPPSDAVDLASVAGHVMDAARPLAAESGVAVTLDVEPDVPAVTGDRDELIQVIENLLENALRYGAGGERVEVSVARFGARVEVAVRDHGDGIAPEHQPRLTQRFYRVNAARSRSRMGTGLGLAIVKHILARHGTRLALESRVGHGARFSFTLPVRVNEAERNQPFDLS